MYANVCLLCVKKEREKETEGVKNIEEAREEQDKEIEKMKKKEKEEGRNVLRYNLLA